MGDKYRLRKMGSCARVTAQGKLSSVEIVCGQLSGKEGGVIIGGVSRKKVLSSILIDQSCSKMF